MTPIECPYLDNGCCGLAAKIAGVSAPQLPENACAACFANRPTDFGPDRLSPVVASQVLNAWRQADATPTADRRNWVRGFLRTVSTSRPSSPAAASADLEKRSLLEQLLPPPTQRHGAKVERWAIGVTTAPRQQPTLNRTLASLDAAGFSDPLIFAEPGSPIDAGWKEKVIRRDRRLGGWGNYIASLVELLVRRPDADAYLMLQDDVLFAENVGNVRAYLEDHVLWPAEKLACVSLYCSSAYSAVRAGWHAMIGRPWIWGALAFLFSPDAAWRMLGHDLIAGHARRQVMKRGFRPETVRRIDDAIGRYAKSAGLPIWYCSPSLCQHIGDHSTLREQQTNTGRRRADRFIGSMNSSSRSGKSLRPECIHLGRLVDPVPGRRACAQPRHCNLLQFPVVRCKDCATCAHFVEL